MGKKFCVLFAAVFLILGITACGNRETDEIKNSEKKEIAIEENDNNTEKTIKKTGSMELEYATQFAVDYYEDGYFLIKVNDGNNYVCVPKGKEENNLGIEDSTFIHYPCENIYLAASSVMDLFREIDSLDVIKSTSTNESDYSIAAVKEKMVSGEINYVGKYKAPDYETLLLLNTDLAIESTMIYHAPKIKEELESFDIPVFVERSSYEENPFGRVEWIKLYGLLSGRLDEANLCYNEQMNKVKAAVKENAVEGEKKSVVFFYVSSNGYVNVRKPGDYISKMIEMAGGSYALKSLEVEEENALSTVNISWEDFYAYAKDADILIYNGTIDGGIKSKDELLEKNEIFEDFLAVKNDRVYCSTNNMYQETSKMGDILVELAKIIDGEEDNMHFIYHLKDE